MNPHSMSKKRVLVIHPSGYISISPTIISTIQYLTQKDEIVHVVAVFGEEVNGLIFQSHYFLQKKKYILLPLFFRVILSFFFYTLYPFLLLSIVLRYTFKSAFLIDAIGLFYSSFLPHSLICTYVVLHIQFLAELVCQRDFIGVFIKSMERLRLKKIKYVVIQDQYRKQSFITENKINTLATTFFIVPNTYRNHTVKQKTHYYQQKLSLPFDTKIVLLAGAIEPWSYPVFVAQCATAQTTPPPYQLVLQSREMINEGTSLIQELRHLEGQNVHLSLTPLAFENLDEACSSAHVGCALYTNNRFQNQTFVGGASGKMLTYLKNGLPVIMMDAKGVTEIIEQYQCGKVLKTMNIADFNACVKEILDNYDYFSANAYRCYQERYDFDSAFDAIQALLPTC